MNSLSPKQESTELNQQSRFITEYEHKKQMKRVQQQAKKAYKAMVAFMLIITLIIILRQFTTSDDTYAGRFYKGSILSYQLDPFWKMTDQQINEEQLIKDKNLITKSSSSNNITRQQLGRNSWKLLHMVTGSFPQNITQSLVDKFNAFLILFGQMYPCKLCANHFMMLLQEQGIFKGNTKQQLMKYLCMIHNKVNQRLNHPIHDCSNVVEEWNTCGCSQE